MNYGRPRFVTSVSDALWEDAPLSDRVLFVASSQLGLAEDPGNRGPVPARYLAACHLNPPNAWCAAFVYWCALHAGVPAASLPLPAIAARVAGWKSWAVAHNRLETKPKRGLAALILDGKTSHAVLVTWSLGKLYRTIEGNASEPGAEAPDAVRRRLRRATSATSFVRLVDLPTKPQLFLVSKV